MPKKKKQEELQGDPLQKAAQEGGGRLIYAALPSREQWLAQINREEAMRKSYAPGCGEPFWPLGPNPVPCGANVTSFSGKTEPWFCGDCKKRMLEESHAWTLERFRVYCAGAA